MKPMGGTEILYLNLMKYLGNFSLDNINIILSTCDYRSIDKNKKNILWQHLNTDEDGVFLLKDERFIKEIDLFVFVSHWQYHKFRKEYGIPAYKSVVIKNAIEPIPYHLKPRTEKLKLIYTSTPWRGLDVLVESFNLLNRSDIELDIYTSTKIYGENFEKQTVGMFDHLYDRARSIKNINLYDYHPNNLIRDALQTSHIMPYPSTFEETSCLSAIEAAAAGCYILTTDLGALPETCSDWAEFVTYGINKDILIHRFADRLNQSIDRYWSDDVQEKLMLQSKHYNSYWSWEYRIREWKKCLHFSE